jgi:hypothetical protein
MGTAMCMRHETLARVAELKDEFSNHDSDLSAYEIASELFILVNRVANTQCDCS